MCWFPRFVFLFNVVIPSRSIQGLLMWQVRGTADVGAPFQFTLTLFFFAQELWGTVQTSAVHHVCHLVSALCSDPFTFVTRQKMAGILAACVLFICNTLIAGWKGAGNVSWRKTGCKDPRLCISLPHRPPRSLAAIPLILPETLQTQNTKIKTLLIAFFFFFFLEPKVWRAHSEKTLTLERMISFVVCFN